MNFSQEAVLESYRCCSRLSRRAHSSFHFAFYLLPPEKRRAMQVLYAFMRFTDDLADAPVPASPCREPLDAGAERAARLETWRDLAAFYLGDPAAMSVRAPRDLSNVRDERLSDGITILPALQDCVRRFRIPSRFLTAILDGVRLDLQENRYRTFAELQEYCELVASAVGLACIHVWGFEGRGAPEQDAVFELARKVGIAYQLTNILRDLKEDAARDRVYLPLDDISAAGYSAEALLAGVVNPAFGKLMRMQIARAEDYYRAGRGLYARIMPDGRKIFGLMTATYHAILQEIAADPAAVFAKRIRPGAFERSRLAVRWTCFPPKELDL
jgi:15-cis-phytoene synthase